MMKSLKVGAAAVPLAAAMLFGAPAAHAYPAADTSWAPFAAVVGKTTFSNSYSFTISTLSDLKGFALPAFIQGFSASLTGPSFSTPLADLSGAYGLQFAKTGLSAGDYSLTFSGTGSTKWFSGYAGAFKVTPAVPEPATVLMALLAAGVLGGVAWRRRSQ